MKKITMYMILMCISFLAACGQKEELQSTTSSETSVNTYLVTMKRDILCLMMAYPGYITGVEQKTDGSVQILMKSGKYILYDDKKTKSLEQKINNPDLQDMMEQIYPLTGITSLMDEDYDPGRVRVYALLKEVYGGSREQIQSNLISVRFGYGSCLFNRNNRAADALKSVGKDLILLAEKRQGIHAFAFPVSGTFNYRLIAGTGLLSPHSFGTAVDLKVDKRDYWKWASREQGQRRLSSYPVEIVQVFEKNGFIWGGKWGHFDIMHYEYRPELILKSRYFADKPASGGQWYEGVPTADDMARKGIELIDNVL